MRNNSIFPLSPVDSRKSFYGKCNVICGEKDGKTVYYLKSYNTFIAKFDGEKIVRLWSGWSATSQRHFNAFADFCGVESLGKKTWDNLPTEY